jgi:hypothetical protein
MELGAAQKGERRNCDACGGKETFGPARTWLRPPGFAHPVSVDPGTVGDERVTRSYATRAKLDAPASASGGNWTVVNDRVKVTMLRKPLLVTNRGPRDDGYSYCTTCGLIEPTALPKSSLTASHPKPYPDPKEPMCAGGHVGTGLVLGTDFITDVLLIAVRVAPPWTGRRNGNRPPEAGADRAVQVPGRLRPFLLPVPPELQEQVRA